MHFDRTLFTCSCEGWRGWWGGGGWGEELNAFRFATFIGRFPSDGAASMAVKGLTSTLAPVNQTNVGGDISTQPFHGSFASLFCHCC